MLTSEHVQRIREANVARAKFYPAFRHRVTGEVIPAGVNLCAMCEVRDLHRGGMHQVMTGKCRTYKGWELF
jgi:hypothetical protein